MYTLLHYLSVSKIQILSTSAICLFNTQQNFIDWRKDDKTFIIGISIYCNKCNFSTLQLHLRVKTSILLVIAASVVTAGVSLLGVLPLDAAGPAATERRLEAEVNVLLGIQTDDEGRDVDNLTGNKIITDVNISLT